VFPLKGKRFRTRSLPGYIKTLSCEIESAPGPGVPDSMVASSLLGQPLGVVTAMNGAAVLIAASAGGALLLPRG
jgi:hypothetical protein